MTPQATGGNGNSSRAVPIATVLYEPDPVLLNQLLASLDRGGRRFYIFVNGPLDPSFKKRLELLSDSVIIYSVMNVGLGAALNAVLERAADDGYQHILLLDQDSTPDPTLPEQLFARFQDMKNGTRPLAILGARLVTPKGMNYKPITYEWHQTGNGAVHFVPTSGSLLSLAAWKVIGPFRADYFIDGIDVEWGFRAWSRGYHLLVATDIVMVHRWGTSSANPDKNIPQILRQSEVRTFYYIRNAVNCLQLPYVPFEWKARKVVVLAGQVARLLQKHHCNRKTRTVIREAIMSGLRGNLGPWLGC